MAVLGISARVSKIRLQRSEAWRRSIEEKVIGIVSEQLNIPKEDIKLEQRFHRRFEGGFAGSG